MDGWDSLVDKKIREAMAAGEFENLSGAGKPIDLSENPFEDPDWRQAHRLLRNAGFAPSWIEERKDIDASLEVTRLTLARTRAIFHKARNTIDEQAARQRWQEAKSSFQVKVAELNR